MTQLRYNRRYIAFNVIALVIFSALAFFTHLTLKSEETLRANSTLNHQLNSFLLVMSERLQSQVEKLRSISSFVALTDDLSPQTFTAYSQEVSLQGDGWLIIEWQPIILGEQRDAFVNDIRQRFFADFDLWETDSSGNPNPAASRDEHVPVLFMLANTEAANTIGLDLAWSEQRMQSKWQARDTGKAQISPLFNVVLSANVQNPPPGFAITVPVYESGMVPDTLQARQQQIMGYIAGVYGIENALLEELEQLHRQGINVFITDDNQPAAVFSATRNLQDPHDHAENTVAGRITLFGREWTVTLNATDVFLGQQVLSDSRLYPILIMLFWLFISVSAWWAYQKNIQILQAKIDLEKVLSLVKTSEQHYAQLSRHDSLTGLYNRRAFVERLEEELSRAERYGQDLCLLLADIDEFKKVNDTFGHLTGDLVLQQFARTCRQCCREQDIVSRYGGEEFAILMINTGIDEGYAICERFLQEIATQSITDADTQQQISVTFSGGLAMYKSGDTSTSMLARADNALYQSKHEGRNRLTAA
ncbi:diguanylate cyclase [Aestuariibacter salexigens]|uniref:sensor domain-containing diguanylate cyclase n=1 Tax=Aestuariibacter salexigens TaxID=226010 RepID=UPI0003FD6E03|nr:diguanylate cyclase [Aestuariibacter salexigens]